jgi:hypothetical protein
MGALILVWKGILGNKLHARLVLCPKEEAKRLASGLASLGGTICSL